MYPLTNSDIIALGLKPYDTIPTTSGTPIVQIENEGKKVPGGPLVSTLIP